MNPVAADFIEQQHAALIDMRRYLHRHPELSGQEFETTKYLAERLEDAGIEFRLGPGNRGLIVDLGDQTSSQRLALRADLDALSIQDAKNVDYRSGVESVMHACGHDAHSAMLLTAILALHQIFEHSPPDYAIRAIFQPEEETARGAQSMIDFGVLDGVTAIVGAHVDPNREVGQIGLRSGIICAHCDEVFVDVHGRGGHAARPAQAIDPVELAAKFVSECYQQVPRYGEEIEVILSFTTIHGGHQQNVIPDEVKLVGTMRSINAEKRIKAIEAVESSAFNLSTESGGRIDVHFGLEVPSMIGDEDTTQNVRAVCQEVVGETAVTILDRPSMGGEDFAFYSRQIPAAFIRLGCKGATTGHFPLHNNRFDVDEGVLPVGAKVITQIALKFFESGD